MSQRQLLAALILAMVLAASGLVYAGIDLEAYNVIGARPAELVTDGSSGESVDLGTLLTDRAQDTMGNPTVAVCAELSTSGATVAVTCVLLDKDGEVLGVQTSTATAGTYRTAAAGDYVAPLLLFDTAGAPQYEIRHAAPSAGSVDLRAWVYGSQTQ